MKGVGQGKGNGKEGKGKKGEGRSGMEEFAEMAQGLDAPVIIRGPGLGLALVIHVVSYVRARKPAVLHAISIYGTAVKMPQNPYW